MATPNRPRWLALAAVLVVGVILGAIFSRPVFGVAQDKDKDKAAHPRYTVVFTEATNLCVTDNQTNTLHFYTIDQGEKPGADLKHRGSVDLTQVGKDVIKPTLTKKE
jgi:hypothetical protein